MEPITLIKLSEEEFFEKYNIQKNHIDNNASWDGCMFETYGEEVDYCWKLSMKENRVWTIIECDADETVIDEDGDEYYPSELYIISGFHFVNRLGFLVSENSYEHETEVKID
jgi:hypothetical protein